MKKNFQKQFFLKKKKKNKCARVVWREKKN